MVYTGPQVLHPEHQEIARTLALNDISNLYHFTCIDNLPGILRHGALHSKVELQSRGLINDVQLGGNEESRRRDEDLRNNYYVSLSYRPRLPMAYHAEQDKHICYLVLSRRLALGDGVVFTDINAASPLAQRLMGFAGVSAVDFPIVKKEYVSRASGELGRKQAEILVPTSVPIDALERVVFRSEASMQEGIRLCEGLDHPKFEVRQSYFNFGSGNLFGCYTAALATGLQTRGINSPHDLPEPRRPTIDASSLIGVKLAYTLRVVPGLVSRIQWAGPRGSASGARYVESTYSFEASGSVKMECTLPHVHLKRGAWEVTLWLESGIISVRQFTLPFTVS